MTDEQRQNSEAGGDAGSVDGGSCPTVDPGKTTAPPADLTKLTHEELADCITLGAGTYQRLFGDNCRGGHDLFRNELLSRLTSPPAGEVEELLEAYSKATYVLGQIWDEDSEERRPSELKQERTFKALRQAIAGLVESNICPGEERPDNYTATDILIFLHQQATISMIKISGEVIALEKQHSKLQAQADALPGVCDALDEMILLVCDACGDCAISHALKYLCTRNPGDCVEVHPHLETLTAARALLEGTDPCPDCDDGIIYTMLDETEIGQPPGSSGRPCPTCATDPPVDLRGLLRELHDLIREYAQSCGHGEYDSSEFYCPYCKEHHMNGYEIPHRDDCIIGNALAKARAELEKGVG